MMNRTDLQMIARIRLREAKTLFRAEQFDGAYYLAGYAVECAFKACIAKNTRRHDFPDKPLAIRAWAHDLKELRRAAELDDAFARDARDLAGLEDNWNIVSQWNEKARYIHGTTSLVAADMLKAVSQTSTGILSWLKKYW